MRPRKHLLVAGAAMMMIAGAACRPTQSIPLSPNMMRELVIPAAGQAQSAVVALNGEPDRRERVDGEEVWVYSRMIPEGAGLRRHSTLVRLREGVVVSVDEAVGPLVVPAPTVPERAAGSQS